MHLQSLHDATQSRLKKLLDLYRSIDQLPRSQQSPVLSYIAIEFDNLNISTLREFTISTIREAKTTKGRRIRVNQSIGPEGEISAYVLSVVNQVKYVRLKSPLVVRRTDEHTIRDPKEIEKVLRHCNASNMSSLQNALSLNSNLFRDIKPIRHFYAHRSKDTFLKARNNAVSMGVIHARHPDQILRHVIAGRPYTILEEWLMEAKLFYQLLME